MAMRVKRVERKAQTRADLITAARGVFLRRGFHAASLDEIAEEAGYTKGAVYSNFSGKDDLFLALLAEHYARRAELYENVMLADGDPERTYRAIARSMLELYEREPGWFPLVSDFATHASRDPELQRRLSATREGFLDALAGTIGQVSARTGTTFALPAREVARGAGALMRGLAVEWAIEPSPTDARAFEEMLAAYLRGLAAPADERSTT